MSLREELITDIQSHDKAWQTMGNFYGALSVAFRLTIIIGSGVAAADAVKSWLLTVHLPLAIPIISLVVSCCAALEAWIKPRDKWRGFMDVREHATDLLRSCKVATDDSPEVASLNDRFIAIKEKHLKENVF